MHPLLSKKIRVCERRVYMAVGSDLEMVGPALGLAEHRLIISDDARPQEYQRKNLVGWRIRMICPEPYCRLLIADDSAQLTELDEAYRFKSFYCIDGPEVERVVAYFESLWASGTDFELPSALDRHWDDTITRLASNPSELRGLDDHVFENLVAELLRRDGFDVELTARTRDGGRDILAWSTGAAGRTLCLVECKRYSAAKKVTVNAVRAAFGVLEQERATSAMIVTTSSFTTPARRFCKSLSKRIVLRQYGDVAKWLRRAADAIGCRS